MKVYNIDCRYIRLNSSAYEKNYTLDNLKSVEVVASVNNGSEIKETIEIGELSHQWTVSIPFDENTRIKQIYVKNVFTRQVFKLLPDNVSYAINENNLTTIKTLVSNTFVSELNLSGVTQSHTISNSILTYSVSVLPFNIGMSSVNMTRGASALNSNSYFTFVDSTKYVLGTESILITPAFFGLDSFKDGIYKFKFLTLDNDNLLVEEETCFFMDCVMGQTLIDAIDVDECEVPDIRMLMMHYGLRVASNSECDCSKMQKVFDFLEEHVESPNTDPCGC